MPQDAHRDAGMDVEGGQERGAGVPGVVDADRRHARPAAVGLEGPVEVTRLDRRAVPRGEDEIGVLPLLPGGLTGVLLDVSAVPERGDAQAEERQRGRRVVGLGRLPVEELAADPVELTGDPQLLAAEVDAVPDQPEHLTPPQA